MRVRANIFAWLLAYGALSAVVYGEQSPDASKSGVPAASSQQERADYRAAAAAGDGAALEKAAGEFAAKYPHSGLRRLLFTRALRQYEIENNRQGILSAGHEVLAIDPGDPLALVLTSTVLADELSAADPDRDKTAAEIQHAAGLAIQNVNQVGSTVAPDQAALYRSTLQSMAYSALGIMKLKTGDDSGAEKDLKTAAGLAKIRPEASIWYHLALAQDHRKKYSAALNSVEQAMQLASSNPQLQRLAQMEHERLTRLAGHGKDSSAPGGEQPPK